MHNEEYQVKFFYQLCSVVLCIVISSMCINREEKKQMNFSKMCLPILLGIFKYLIMLAMLDGAAYIAFERKASKAIPLILVLGSSCLVSWRYV
ncbi:hypothetical protein JG559_07610 [Enterococcus faecalis]|uniref:Uncharacterized protein n=1 Tax=Enterococcus faecalis TaxID=1351 RepID=A0A974NZ57_ENTFL|nr:hypothetical protein JG559_07610 [Enterococcus faecalis]